jgi:ribonuclease Z
VSFIGRGLQYELLYQPLAIGFVFMHRQLECHAFPTRHRVRQSYGFTFQEKARRRFLADVAARIGVPEGPERRRLLEGESIRSYSGQIITPDEVLGPAEPGKKLVYISDTAYFPELSHAAAGADCLIAEATFLDADAALAAAVGHMTATQAAMVAREADVKRLSLNHISQRYTQTEHLILEEAQRVFPNTYLANDFDTIAV